MARNQLGKDFVSVQRNQAKLQVETKIMHSPIERNSKQPSTMEPVQWLVDEP